MDFTQSALAHVNIVFQALWGLIVSGVMLDARANLAVLDTVDVASGKSPTKNGIFTKGLETPAKQWGALDTHCWSEGDVDSLSAAFVTQELSQFVQKIYVEGRTKTCCARKLIARRLLYLSDLLSARSGTPGEDIIIVSHTGLKKRPPPPRKP